MPVIPPARKQFPSYAGGPISPSWLKGFPVGDATQVLRGDGSWGPVPTTAGGVPPGVMFDFAGTTSPTGYLMCDGASYLRTAFPDLFAAIGTTWGAVDGTHFNVPDCRGRMTVGLGTHADVAALAASDGLAVGNRRPKHKH